MKKNVSICEILDDHLLVQIVIFRQDNQEILYLGGHLFKSYGYTEEDIRAIRKEGGKSFTRRTWLRW